MDNSLTLPGTIPGLLRRGSPVIVDYPHKSCTGVVVDIPAGFEVAIHAENDISELDEYTSEQVALDLTDATGRAHAAWWMAERRGRTKANSLLARWVWGCSRPGWIIDCGPTFARIWFWAEGPLEGLNRDVSGKLLPDGSRWVDAEALRRVCLHVAGLEE